MGSKDRDEDKNRDENKGRDEGRHRDKTAEEITGDGQQEGRSVPPVDDGREKH
ncbi:MAG: hypothetical protein ACRDTC_10415 [Pseudonocardiaceae bacterium]